jgi:hypothetical protein
VRFGTKAVLFCCLALLAAALIYRADVSLDPARPSDMPANSRFIPTRYDLSHNERKGLWVFCGSGDEAGVTFCRVADASGVVIFQGDFLPVRNSQSSPNNASMKGAGAKLTWVNGPSEGSPVPVIPMTDGSMLVPRDDRDALIHRWNTHPDEWQKLQSPE